MQLQMTGELQEFDAYERRAVAGIRKRLSDPMMLVLKRHGDGPQPIVMRSVDYPTTVALRGRGLLNFDHHARKTPRETTATTLGRKVIALMLAEEADVLIDLAVREVV
jgi:hypothetical protein